MKYAFKYLTSLGINVKDYNTYGSRRGNDLVLSRGTFGNIRLKNHLTPENEGSYTILHPDDEIMSIYEAAMEYKKRNVPLIILAGKDYGTGSSRDWAAKGPLLLGVKAIIAESYERIHRSNLIGMGILPLQFLDGENAKSLGLTGREVFDILEVKDIKNPQAIVKVKSITSEKDERTFETIARIDTTLEMKYFNNGGIMQSILRDNI